MKHILYFFCSICLLFTACEKAVDFKLNPTTPSLVVEATIENDQPPYVILSKSLDYFGKITPDMLMNSFVHNAIITISNGTKTHQLKEYNYTAGSTKLYYYSIDSANLSTAFKGAFKTNYSIEIKADSQTITSTTTIPALGKKIDSIWWKKVPLSKDTNKVVLVVKATDPPGFGNYIRYFTKQNNNNFNPGLNSVFDDQVIDGTTYTTDVERGVNRNEERSGDDYSFFDRGDTITLKLTEIDKATFDFWRTMEYSYNSIGNPFASPTKVTSNVKGALGYFGGYAVQYKTLIVPK